MTCAAPEGTPPRRFNYLKIPPLASQEPVTDASRSFIIFHGLGETHARSFPFLLSKKWSIPKTAMVSHTQTPEKGFGLL